MDKPGQVWLPGVPSPERVRVADVCLRRLCRDFIQQCPTNSETRLSSDLDDLSLAVLLLSVEWGNDSPEETAADLKCCFEKVANRFWLDILPWKLALEFSGSYPNFVSGLRELIANLDHHSSSVRGWMLRLGWIVRERIPREDAAPKLLRNVASTLLFVEESVGLCRALFPTDDAFWEMADSYEANEYADQYNSRLALVREKGFAVFQHKLQIEELRPRQKVCEAVLGLTSEDFTSNEGTP